LYRRERRKTLLRTSKVEFGSGIREKFTSLSDPPVTGKDWEI
jgi:hypothetical protein